MNVQDVILGARVVHVRELKAEITRLKAENSRLNAENAELRSHFALALLAAEDLRRLPDGGRLVIVDGWNLVLAAEREASDKDDLVRQVRAHLAEHPLDFAWIVFDGSRENSTEEGRLRISYTGGVGTQRADRMICDFLRMARLSGDVSRIDVRTHDKELLKTVDRLKSQN